MFATLDRDTKALKEHRQLCEAYEVISGLLENLDYAQYYQHKCFHVVLAHLDKEMNKLTQQKKEAKNDTSNS